MSHLLWGNHMCIGHCTHVATTFHDKYLIINMTTQGIENLSLAHLLVSSQLFFQIHNTIVFIFNCLFCCTVSDRKFAGFIEVEFSSEIEMLMSIQEFC